MNFFNSNNINFNIQALAVSLKLNFFFGNIAFISLFIAVLLYWFDFFDTRRISKKLKNICMIGSNISLACLLLLRWIESGHFPLSNLYESLIGLSWCFTSVHLMIVLNPIEFFARVLNSTSKPIKSKIISFQKDFQNPQTDTVLSYGSFAKDGSKQQVSGAPNVFITLRNSKTTTQPSNYSSSSSFLPKLHFSSSESLNLPLQENILSLNRNSIINKEMNSDLSKVNDKIGAITAPTALLTSVFATFFLPPEITQATALIPALKSNWLTMHVTVMVASYAFLLIGSLLSITYCVYRLVSQFSTQKEQKDIFKSNSKQKEISFEKTFFNAKNPINYQNQSAIMAGVAESSNHSHQETVLKIIPDKNNYNLAIWLNTTSYRILGLGFPLLTIGILSGAVWANEAWGSYWSWDPKETWALITWLVFAVYFHSRYTRSSDSFVPATIASVGFIIIWICYLGVNLLGTGLHSYGWFSS